MDYIAPNDMLAGQHDGIIAERDRRLQVVRERRRRKRQDLARRMGIPQCEQPQEALAA